MAVNAQKVSAFFEGMWLLPFIGTITSVFSHFVFTLYLSTECMPIAKCQYQHEFVWVQRNHCDSNINVYPKIIGLS